MARTGRPIEWPTLAMLIFCYFGWAVATTWVAVFWLPLAVIMATGCIALHSSLSHEVLHGHPFGNQTLNEMLVFPCLGLFVPFHRFRDTHLAHHKDANLTDPYDDPETNFLDPEIWSALPVWVHRLLTFNNTLLGRLIVGPVVGQAYFIRADARAVRAGEIAVLRGWLWHIPAVTLVLVWVVWSPMPLWAYLIAAYAGLSILKIRTFLEHRAHERASGRTVVIEDKGPLAWIFLNNNLHVVHHMHPDVAWYQLPRLYAGNRDKYLTRNGGYRYRSYAEIFRQYFWRPKDPVPHPLWRKP